MNYRKRSKKSEAFWPAGPSGESWAGGREFGPAGEGERSASVPEMNVRTHFWPALARRARAGWRPIPGFPKP